MVKHGSAPYLECSSKGEKRLSAFYARIQARGNKSIEELYQAAKIFEDGRTGLSWREAKGKQAVNMPATHALYALLWDEYMAENPDLLVMVVKAAGLSDMFGKVGNACQATELWRIRGRQSIDVRLLQQQIDCAESKAGDLFSRPQVEK